jgi:tetratricopeptide (TPR) repeat protein
LTPRYASPEQLRGEPFTTVSDVFSLGVLAYELLTGAWPFGNPDSAVDELDRVLRGRRPSLPAAVVTASAAEERSVSRDRLQRELSGDLSTIVLKMLETEPARRYGSAREVEEDLERYREGRPILARPLTAWYAARKFVGRHWLGVSAASATVAALAGLTAFSVYQSIEARNQAARAKRISEFAKNTFFSASSTWSSPLRGQSRAIQVSDILDNAVERAGKELGSDPVAEADLRGTLGMTYAMLGNPVKGEAQIRLAIARLAATPERSSRLAADLQDRLCNALSYEGRYLEALDACHSATALARVYGSAYGLRGVLHDTAFMTVKSGAPFEDAEKLFREALDAPAADADAEAKLTPALVGTRIGSLRLRLGDLVEGNRMLSDAERILRSTPGPPIEIIPTLSALAYGARVKGDYARAVRFLDESVRLLTERPTPYMGIESIELDLAAAEALAGNEESALARLKRLNVESILADSSPVDRIHTETAAGIAEARCGQTDSAERRLRSALEISKKDAARQPGDRVEIYLRLAQLLTANGKTEEAGEVASQGLRDAEIAYGPFFARHPFVKQLREVHP